MSLRTTELFLPLLFLALTTGTSLSQHRTSPAETAWDQLLQENPQAVDDPSLSWRDRLILHVLSPGQAEDFYLRGVEAGNLTLPTGRTLSDYLEARFSPAGNLYVQLPASCRLFSGQMLEEGEHRLLRARGGDLSTQGGSQDGCEIPADTVALVLQMAVEAPFGGRVKLWSADSPEPARAVVEGSHAGMDLARAMALVALCKEDCWEGDFQIRSSQVVEIQGDVMGYFRPLRPEDHPGSGFAFSTEGSSNNFFGTGAGASITSGEGNSFFGGNAGNANTSGNFNAFFGENSGLTNTTGSFNTFFGADAGRHNSTGSSNSFFGDNSGLFNTSGSLNAFFGDDAGLSNSTGSFNSFFGENSGIANTTGTRNTFLGNGAVLGNTTGQDNSGLGMHAGSSNSVENENTFLGAFSNLDPGADPMVSPVTNATAVGHRAYVSQSNSLVLGSINGFNAATADVKVGIGAPAPKSALHVKRVDGSSQILVEEAAGSSAVRTLFQLLNNGAPRFALRNSASGHEWSFQQSGPGDFLISLEGTGGAELALFKNGRLRVGHGASVKFDLAPNGDLMIAGDLTANGMTYSSDRNLKTDFLEIDNQEVLRRVSKLPISEWRFKSEKSDVRHTGPMAQDFHAAFKLGKDERHINPADISGVALAAIQGMHVQHEADISRLEEEAREKDTRLGQQQEEIDALKARLAAIERLLQANSVESGAGHRQGNP